MFQSFRSFYSLELTLVCHWYKLKVDLTTYQVTKSQDSFTVGDDDRPNVVLRPVAQDVVHVALVVDGDEQTLKNRNTVMSSR